MSQSAPATIPPAEDARGFTWALDRVPRPTPGEIRLLHRISPARAHRRLAEYVEDYVAAMAADAATKRSAARDDEHLEQLQEDYADGIVSQHDRASEDAWDEHRRLLERASSSGLAEAAKAHNAAPTWLGLGALQRAAEARGALQREGETKIRPRARGRVVQSRGARTRPRIRRAAARRAAGARAGQDPGDDDPDPHDGAARLAHFQALPVSIQDAFWRFLARQVERGRA